VNKTWKPIAAGILDLFIGSVELLFAIIVFWIWELRHDVELSGIGELLIKNSIPISIPFSFVGILALVGGVYALRRKKWELAFTASIMAFILLMPWMGFFLNSRHPAAHPAPSLILLLGIAAIVLTALARKEFEQREELRRILKKTWMPIAAGILDIFSGAFQLLAAIFFHIASMLSDTWPLQDWETYLVVTALVLSAFLAIGGSIHNMRRTNWPLAMAGSIAASALFPLVVYFVVYEVAPPFLIIMLPGIIAIVLTVLSRKEFERH